MTGPGELVEASHTDGDYHYQIRDVDGDYVVYMHYENVLDVYQEEIVFRAPESADSLSDNLTTKMFVAGWCDWETFETLEAAQEAVEARSPKPGTVWHGQLSNYLPTGKDSNNKHP